MCVDPATAALIVSVTATAGQGVAAYAQGQAQSSGLKTAADQATMASAVEETNIRRQSREFLAQQRVQALGSGADIRSGSLAQVAETDAATLELNALMRRYEGQVEREDLRFQARQATRAGTIALGTSLLSAGSQALGAMKPAPGSGSTGGGKIGKAGGSQHINVGTG
jgi:hypothetical protein